MTSWQLNWFSKLTVNFPMYNTVGIAYVTRCSNMLNIIQQSVFNIFCYLSFPFIFCHFFIYSLEYTRYSLLLHLPQFLPSVRSRYQSIRIAYVHSIAPIGRYCYTDGQCSLKLLDCLQSQVNNHWIAYHCLILFLLCQCLKEFINFYFKVSMCVKL